MKRSNWIKNTLLISLISTVTMAGPPTRIRFFVNAQQYYRMLGLYPSQQLDQKCHANWKNILCLYLHLQMLISPMAFCFFEAKTMFEYCFNIYVFITESTTIFLYAHQMFQIVNILNFIQSIEKLIEKCKFLKYFTAFHQLKNLNRFLELLKCKKISIQVSSHSPSWMKKSNEYRNWRIRSPKL